MRMCVDFRDLNKACLKNYFPLAHIDVLGVNTACSALMSFMDGFSTYNQIKMAPEDMTMTTFTIVWGIYCYIVMPFGLKNARATCQRKATALLHDIMHNEVKVYADDMSLNYGRTSMHMINEINLFINKKGRRPPSKNPYKLKPMYRTYVQKPWMK